MGALALGVALIAAPRAAEANLLLNGSLEATVTVKRGSSGFPVPAPPGTPDFDEVIGFQSWAVSAHNRLGGIAGSACPAAFGLGCSGKGNWVATVNSSLPSGALPTPVAMYQTVGLQAGAYRFGGDFAMSIFAVAVGDIETEAFLRIYAGGITFDSFGVPTIAGGSVLAAIDLSPGRFDPNDFFIEGMGLSPVGKSRRFETFDEVFTLASDSLVTMQVVILPKRTKPVAMPPYNDTGSAGLVQATNLTLWADNLFIEPTRLEPQPVPAPGALGLFAVALAGLVAVRRRKMA